MLDGSASGLAEHTDAMRVVDDHDRVVLPPELDDLRELGEIALHREHAVREDLPRVARSIRERGSQRRHVRVRIDDLRGRLRKPHRVDDARVIELVGEDHRRSVGERRDDRFVRVPARDVAERSLRACEVGERAFELECGAGKSRR